jgi:hypothetical protein
MKTKINVHKKEQDVIIEQLSKYGRKAYDTTLANGVSVTILKGNDVCRIDPNGDVSVVTRIKKAKVKVTESKFKLK